MPKVHLDAGHGGSDPGAVGNGLVEKELTLILATKVLNILAPYCTVYMSRSGDDTVSIDSRCSYADEVGTDIMVSLHINASGNGNARGIGIWHSIYSQPGAGGNKLANCIMNHIIVDGFTNYGIHTRKGSNGDYYGVIREPKATSIIVEHGFIDNAHDAALLSQPKVLDHLAMGDALGILDFFGITYKSPVIVNPIPAPTPAPNGIWRVQVGAFEKEAGAEAYIKRLDAAGFHGAFKKFVTT